MFYFFSFIIAILILLVLVGDSEAKSIESLKKSKIDVILPNPEITNDEEMIKYIHNTFSIELKSVYEELNKQEYFIKPFVRRAFEEKIKNHILVSNDFLEIIYPSLKLSKDYVDNFTFDVAGVHIPNRKSFIRNECEIYDFIDLEPEPNNPFGSDAIKVKCHNKLIGYVPSIDTFDVHEILKHNYIAYVECISDIDNFLEVTVKINFNK